MAKRKVALEGGGKAVSFLAWASSRIHFAPTWQLDQSLSLSRQQGDNIFTRPHSGVLERACHSSEMSNFCHVNNAGVEQPGWSRFLSEDSFLSELCSSGRQLIPGQHFRSHIKREPEPKRKKQAKRASEKKNKEENSNKRASFWLPCFSSVKGAMVSSVNGAKLYTSHPKSVLS